MSRDLANWFNKLKKDDGELITPTFFLNQQSKIKIMGALYNDAKVELYKTGVFKKIFVSYKYSDCIAITNKTRFSKGSVKIFRPIRGNSELAENNLSIAQDKKTNMIFFGYLEPMSNHKYNILDISASTGKVMGIIAKNINLSWSSKQEIEFPSNTNEFLTND